jgi:hypothetical protein
MIFRFRVLGGLLQHQCCFAMTQNFKRYSPKILVSLRKGFTEGEFDEAISAG